MQRRSAGGSINWHWDKDEQLRDACGVVVHPYVSTVTYLSSGGAPTVLLGAQVTQEGQLRAPFGEGEPYAGSAPLRSRDQPGSLSATVSYPRRRKVCRAANHHRMPAQCLHRLPPPSAGTTCLLRAQLLRFSGRLLHGCPSALAEPLVGERLTLLINVWRGHRPLNLAPLPRSTCRRLRCRALPPLLRSVTPPPAASPQQPLYSEDTSSVHPRPAMASLRVPVCEGAQMLCLELPLPATPSAPAIPLAVGKGTTHSGGPSASPAGSGTATYTHLPLVVRRRHRR